MFAISFTEPLTTMKKHSFELKALDTLFFKDGKPFTMGEESWAKGIFPPYPSTIYGMLRSTWFAENMEQLEFANVPNQDETLNLEIKGYLPALDSVPAFPLPADLYGTGEQENVAQVLKLKAYPSTLLSEYPHSHILCADFAGKYEDLNGKTLLKVSDFGKYLNAEDETYPYAQIKDYTCEEPKVGIGRDRSTRTASEGKLYRIAMHRLANKEAGKTVQTMSFLLKAEGLGLPQNGMARFGAETKSAAYAPTSFPDIPSVVSKSQKRFKIYLATPAVFAEGSYPKSWFERNGIELIAAAIGKPEHIGGFDMKAGRPKPMHKAVPAGTVYYVEIINDALAQGIQEKLHQGSIYALAKAENSFANSYKAQGFGLTFIGNIHPQNI